MKKDLTKEQLAEIHRPGWHWAGRSLENYKAMQTRAAESKGVLESLKAAKTLTQARKIVYGYKRGMTK